MIPFPCSSRAAEAAGIPSRYLFWFGRSGRRYLFTCTERGGVDDFIDGVAIIVRAGEIVWTGEIAAMTSVVRGGGPATSLYVHLLAATAEERRAVIDDLRPADGAQLRLAA